MRLPASNGVPPLLLTHSLRVVASCLPNALRTLSTCRHSVGIERGCDQLQAPLQQHRRPSSHLKYPRIRQYFRPQRHDHHACLNTALPSWLRSHALRTATRSLTTNTPAAVAAATTPVSTPRNNQAELLQVVYASLPRAPLYSTVSMALHLALHHEVDPPPSHHTHQLPTSCSSAADTRGGHAGQVGEPTPGSPSLLKAQQQQKQKQKQQQSSANAAIASARLREIRHHYGSFQNMLKEMCRRSHGLARTASHPQQQHEKAEDVVSSSGDGDVERCGVYLSIDLLFVTVAASAEDAGRTFRLAYDPLPIDHRLELQHDLANLSDADTRDALEGVTAAPCPEGSANEWDLFSPAELCYQAFDAATAATAAPASEHALRVARRRQRRIADALTPSSTRNPEPLLQVYAPYFGADFVPPPAPDWAADCGQQQHQQQHSKDATSSLTSSRVHSSAQSSSSPLFSSSTTASVSRSFSPSQIGALLPTYFVPLGALLAQLPPGYTADHVRATFGTTGAVEVVQLGSDTFVRFHGGDGGFGFSPEVLRSQQLRFAEALNNTAANTKVKEEDEEGEGKERRAEKTCGRVGGSVAVAAASVRTAAAAAATPSTAISQLGAYMAAYQPDPFLFRAFLPCFPRPYEWVRLYDLVQHAPPAVQKALLPLREQHTLLFFAQLQQHANFTPQTGGRVALAFPPTRALRETTTPLPCVVAEMSSLLSGRGALYVEELEQGLGGALSDYAKRRIIACFGTVRRFLYQHEALFRLSVIASPATLLEAHSAARMANAATARNKVEKDEEGASRDEQDEKERSGNGAANCVLSGMGGEDEALSPTTPVDAFGLPPLPASLPHRGAGFAAVPQPYHYLTSETVFTKTTSNTHGSDGGGGGGGNRNGIHSGRAHAESAAAEAVSSLPPQDNQLDADGFPLWLQSRDVVVQLASDAKSHDKQRLRAMGGDVDECKSNSLRRLNRKRRRQRAGMLDPNSPFNDASVLLDAIVRYLPEKRHVSLRALLLSLPQSMQDFLPGDTVALFRNAPDKVQLFEYKRQNHLRVMRVGLPLPDGRLKASYTVDELLVLIAAVLLPPGQPKRANHIFGLLPYGARNTIRQHHKDLTVLLEGYPDYFLLVFRDARKALTRDAWVTLLRPLPQLSRDDVSEVVTTAAMRPMSDEEAAAVDCEDMAMLRAELPAELSQTLSPPKPRSN